MREARGEPVDRVAQASGGRRSRARRGSGGLPGRPRARRRRRAAAAGRSLSSRTSFAGRSITSATRSERRGPLLLDREADELEDVVGVRPPAPAGRRARARARSRAGPAGRGGSRGPPPTLARDDLDLLAAASRRAPTAKRSGSSLGSSTTNAPATPCGRPTRPTRTVSLTTRRSRAARARAGGARADERAQGARAMRPWRPITLPTSSGATWSPSTVDAVALARSTRTACGSSTSRRARSSTSRSGSG